MSASVEKQARKALRRMVVWRLVGELLMIPQALVAGLHLVCSVLLNWLKTVELTLFYLELDAARKYKLLTGVDLAAASGAPARYGPLLHTDLTDDAQRDFLREHMGQGDE